VRAVGLLPDHSKYLFTFSIVPSHLYVWFLRLIMCVRHMSLDSIFIFTLHLLSVLTHSLSGLKKELASYSPYPGVSSSSEHALQLPLIYRLQVFYFPLPLNYTQPTIYIIRHMVPSRTTSERRADAFCLVVANDSNLWMPNQLDQLNWERNVFCKLVPLH
jgi:hypothetical protein